MLHDLNEFVVEHSALISFISLAIGIVGIFLAIFFYLRSKPIKLLAFASRTFRVITDTDRSKKIKGLEVRVFGRLAPVVTVTRLALWNAGNRTIQFEDIAEKDPLRLLPTGVVEVFSIELLEQTKEANQVSFLEVQDNQDNPNAYKISFDYLDPGDGILINLVHSGMGLEEFKIVGSIKGGNVRRASSSPGIIRTIPVRGGPPIIKTESGRQSIRRASLAFLALACLFSLLYLINQSHNPVFLHFWCFMLSNGGCAIRFEQETLSSITLVYA